MKILAFQPACVRWNREHKLPSPNLDSGSVSPAEEQQDASKQLGREGGFPRAPL